MVKRKDWKTMVRQGNIRHRRKLREERRTMELTKER